MIIKCVQRCARRIILVGNDSTLGGYCDTVYRQECLHGDKVRVIDSLLGEKLMRSVVSFSAGSVFVHRAKCCMLFHWLCYCAFRCAYE